MAATMHVRALVVQEYLLGEQDKRLTLISVDHGRFSAIAKGAKKQGARLAAAAQLFTYADFVMDQSRGSWILREATPIEQFYAIRQDPEALAWASWMVETARDLAVEGEACNDMLRILLRGLQLITEPSLSAQMTATAFVLRSLAMVGLRPQTERCLSCGAVPGEGAALSVQAGGVLCADCARRHGDAMSVGPAVLYTLRYVLEADEAKLYKFTVEPGTREALFLFASRFLMQYLQREPESLRFLREWRELASLLDPAN
ncbi:MAG: DNA repair protein RecO [Firmicutes bacterium]|nr:DNA repair protein RecO [Bacillota bacterium]